MIGENLGPYHLDAEIGSGAMGRVYRATGPQGTVAVKVIHRPLLLRPGFLERFLREAEVGRSVVHPNVVRTLDQGVAGPDRYLVLEYVEGRTLHGLLEEFGCVPEELCRHIGREVAEGLAAIHAAGAVHRDVRPANILVTRDHVVKVMDFGASRAAGEGPADGAPGAFAGSLHYASPEHLAGRPEALEARSDLYSLGVILYELSCGEHPRRGDRTEAVLYRVLREDPRRLGERHPQVSPFFEEVVHVLLARRPEDRFPSASALAETLAHGEDSRWWRERAVRATQGRTPRRLRVLRETAVHGREAELAELRCQFEAARGGTGQVVVVEGEAGIGKSRLLEEFFARLTDAGEEFLALTGACPPAESAPGRGAWVTALREHFGPEAIQESVARHLASTPSLVPGIAAVLRGDALPPGADFLTMDSFRAGIVAIIRSLAADRPVVVLIEDLHFGSEPGLALFAALALAVPGHRILLVGTTRPALPEEVRVAFAARSWCRRLLLPRLSPESVTDLVADALRSRPLAETLSPRIAARSDGNPFLVFEILKTLRDGRRILRQANGVWAAAEETGAVETPSTVRDAVRARVSALEEADRRLLEAACCCGFAFDPLLAGEAEGLPRLEALMRLGHIERRHRLVRFAGHRCEFDHHLVHEALYGELAGPRREALHAAIAGAISRRNPSLSGAEAADFCGHCLQGGLAEQARPHLDAALDHLERSYRPGAFVTLADRTLALPGLLAGPARADLLLRLAAPGGPLDLLGHPERMSAAGREALSLARQIGDPQRERRALEVLWAALLAAGRPAEAREQCERCLAYAREVGDRAGEARTGIGLAKALMGLGRYPEAQEHCAASLALARDLGDQRTADRALATLGAVFLRLGRHQEAIERFGEALRCFRESGDRRMEAATCRSLGVAYCETGRHAEAREQFEQAVAAARDIGDRKGEANATGGLGYVLFMLDRHAEAKPYYERWLGLSREVGDRLGEANALGNLGSALWSLGLLGAGREHLEQSIALSREIGDHRAETTVMAHLGHLLLLLGRPAEARGILDYALSLARKAAMRREAAYALAGLAAADDAEGDPATAQARHEEALALRRTIADPAGIADSLYELSEFDRRRGNPVAAVARLEEARDLARQASSRALLALATARLAGSACTDVARALAVYAESEAHLDVAQRMQARFLLFEASGDRTHLREAKRLLDALVDHAPADCRDSMRTVVRLHREIAAAADRGD